MIKLFLSVISIFFSILMIYLTQINFKKKLIGILGYFFWQILWIGIIIISIRPKYIDRFIEEQLDTNLFYIITVLSLIFLLIVSYMSIVRINSLEKKGRIRIF